MFVRLLNYMLILYMGHCNILLHAHTHALMYACTYAYRNIACKLFGIGQVEIDDDLDISVKQSFVFRVGCPEFPQNSTPLVLNVVVQD